MNDDVIKVSGLSKRFGATSALADVEVSVPRGSVLGLLGDNGAGKTTLVNVLATLTTPTSGTATVCGFDVVRDAHQVRRRIGVTGQLTAVEGQLSARDNLVLTARLLGADPRAARARADLLLEVFGLGSVSGRAIRTYSGGMRRRVDLALSLVGNPEVLFLDEPTTGLDPASRLTVWALVRALVGDGTSVLLTTQYLEEADRLADSITVLSSGRVIAAGSPSELKSRFGRRTVRMRFTSVDDVPTATHALRRVGLEPAVDETTGVTVTVPVAASADLAGVVRALDAAGVEAAAIALTEPGLDETFVLLSTAGAS